jgi:hypothetical protein
VDEIMKKILSLIMIVSMVLSGLIVGQMFISNPVSAPGPDLPDLAIWPENITLSTINPVGQEILLQ